MWIAKSKITFHFSNYLVARIVAVLAVGAACQVACEKVQLRNPSLEGGFQSNVSAQLQDTSYTPRLEIHSDAISHNARVIKEQATQRGAQIAAVVKGAGAHPAVVRAVERAGIDMIADSRLSNLRAVREAGFRGQTLLLRPAGTAQAQASVELANISLVGHIDVAQALSRAATAKALPRHKIILMVESGDLREGVYPHERALEIAAEIVALPGIELIGIGSNFACSSGVLPSQTSLTDIDRLAKSIEERIGKTLTHNSIGNSSGLPLLNKCPLPPKANHYRIGESILLGTNAVDGLPWKDTRQDTFTFVAEVIEIYEKPSLPWGPLAKNAFGETPTFEDIGFRTRAILNAGRQDVVHTGLEPENTCAKIVTSSSDHLIVDVHDCPQKPNVGQEIRFSVNYPALLQASTSRDVAKVEVPHIH